MAEKKKNMHSRDNIDLFGSGRRLCFSETSALWRKVWTSSIRVTRLEYRLAWLFFFFFSCQQFAESAQSQWALLSLPSVREKTKLLYKFTTISYIDVWGCLLFPAFKSPLHELIKSQCSFFLFYDNTGFTGRVRNVCFDVHTLDYRWTRAEEGEEESGIVEDGIKRGERRHWWRRGRKGKMRKCKEPETYQETTGATN